jgi:hypothetical protein
MVDSWSSGFDGVEEMDIDFCFYVSPFPMVTARQPHAAALPLKYLFYCPLRGRRSLCSLSLRSLKVGESLIHLQIAQFIKVK